MPPRSGGRSAAAGRPRLRPDAASLAFLYPFFSVTDVAFQPVPQMNDMQTKGKTMVKIRLLSSGMLRVWLTGVGILTLAACGGSVNSAPNACHRDAVEAARQGWKSEQPFQGIDPPAEIRSLARDQAAAYYRFSVVADHLHGCPAYGSGSKHPAPLV